MCCVLSFWSVHYNSNPEEGYFKQRLMKIIGVGSSFTWFESLSSPFQKMRHPPTSKVSSWLKSLLLDDSRLFFENWTTEIRGSQGPRVLQNLFKPIVCIVRSSMRRSVSFACIIYDSMGKESCYLKKCFVPLMSNTTYRIFGPLRHPIDVYLIFISIISSS